MHDPATLLSDTDTFATKAKFKLWNVHTGILSVSFILHALRRGEKWHQGFKLKLIVSIIEICNMYMLKSFKCLFIR